METIPQEINILGVYLPPLLLAAAAAIATTSVLVIILNHYNISKYFLWPAGVYWAIIIILTIVFGYTISPF